VSRQLTKLGIEVEHLPSDKLGWRRWLRLLRIHQYAKNGPVFVPMITGHQFSVASVSKSSAAFVAFSLCASSIYIVNDLVDLQADRTHPESATVRWRAAPFLLFKASCWRRSFRLSAWPSQHSFPIISCRAAGIYCFDHCLLFRAQAQHADRRYLAGYALRGARRGRSRGNRPDHL
jgi:hypothetical protein